MRRLVCLSISATHHQVLLSFSTRRAQSQLTCAPSCWLAIRLPRLESGSAACCARCAGPLAGQKSARRGGPCIWRKEFRVSVCVCAVHKCNSDYAQARTRTHTHTHARTHTPLRFSVHSLLCGKCKERDRDTFMHTHWGTLSLPSKRIFFISILPTNNHLGIVSG